MPNFSRDFRRGDSRSLDSHIAYVYSLRVRHSPIQEIEIQGTLHSTKTLTEDEIRQRLIEDLIAEAAPHGVTVRPSAPIVHFTYTQT